MSIIDPLVLGMTQSLIREVGKESIIERGEARFIIDTLFATMPDNPPKNVLNILVNDRVRLEELVSAELGVKRDTTLPPRLIKTLEASIAIFATTFSKERLRSLDLDNVIALICVGPPSGMDDNESYLLQSEVVAYKAAAKAFLVQAREKYLNGQTSSNPSLN